MYNFGVPVTFAYDPSARVTRRDYQDSLLSAAKRNCKPGGKDFFHLATGGGKTVIISDFSRWAAKSGKSVLVVTKDWELLGQIAGDLCRRHRDGTELCGYVGNSSMAKRLFKGLNDDWGSPITFTTIQTWNNRENQPKPDIVVIDELHWGEGATLYTKLQNHCGQNTYFLGATATPRRWSRFRRIGKAYDFGELIRRKVLSQPIIEEPIQTGTHWTPERTSDHGDLTQQSLDQLASNVERNDLIVATYMAKRQKYGKTIVFACHIDHAESLQQKFQAAGVNAAYVHHKLSTTKRREVLDAFRNGETDVLINVTMLTHGVDIPDIKTVFLTRPTLSDILFSQMVGRGARRTETKDTFYVVDFVDIVDQYGLPIVRPGGFFGNARVRPRARGVPQEQHKYEPAEFFQFPEVDGYEDIAGLDIHPRQTFGLEFELSHPRGTHVDDMIHAVLRGLQGTVPVAERRSLRRNTDYRVWNAVRDGSCGLEIVSRILQGSEGFVEVMDASRRLREIAQELGLSLTVKTGTHAHLAYPNHRPSLRNVAVLAAYYEPALYTLVSPSRIDNHYAESLRPVVSGRRQISRYGRYRTVNFESIRDHKTLEVRLHNGTLNGAKILTWVSLWMRILERCRRRVNLPRTYQPLANGHLFSGGQEADVRSLAEFVQAGPVLTYRLLARREQLGERHWHAKLPEGLRQQWWSDAFTAYVDSVAQGASITVEQ